MGTVGELVSDVRNRRIRLPRTPRLARLPTRRSPAGIRRQYLYPRQPWCGFFSDLELTLQPCHQPPWGADAPGLSVLHRNASRMSARLPSLVLLAKGCPGIEREQVIDQV